MFTSGAVVNINDPYLLAIMHHVNMGGGDGKPGGSVHIQTCTIFSHIVFLH